MRTLSKLTACVSISLLLGACGDRGADNLSPAVPQAANSAAPESSSGGPGLLPSAPGLSVYDAATLQARRVPRSACAVDKINGALVRGEITPVQGELNLSGWILDTRLHAPVDFAVLLLSEGNAASYAFKARAGDDRPDVATKLKSEFAVKSGFNANTGTGSLPPGIYSLILLQDANNAPSMCVTKRKIRVGAEG